MGSKPMSSTRMPSQAMARRVLFLFAAAASLGPAPLLAQRAGVQTQAQAPAVPPTTGDPWRIVTLTQSSLVYGRDGSLIGEISNEISKEMRTLVQMRTLPKYVPQAFVAIEDQRFYQHDG